VDVYPYLVDLQPADAFLKLTRADEHLDSLEAEIQRWAATHPYRIIRERDDESGATVVYAEPTGEPPLKLALILGDVVQNLRACLDHLALALAERNYGGPLPEEAQRDSQFPICDTPKQFSRARKRDIPHIAKEAQAIIEKLQPYAENGGGRNPLAILNELSNHDKHRRLPLVAQHARLTTADVPAEHWQAKEFELNFPRMFEEKTELFRSHGLQDRSGNDLDVDFRLAVTVAFSDQAPPAVARSHVQPVLDEIFMHIGKEVVLPLKPYLE
jgi:hypothetical protein